jgi:hypothetical protein
VAIYLKLGDFLCPRPRFLFLVPYCLFLVFFRRTAVRLYDTAVWVGADPVCCTTHLEFTAYSNRWLPAAYRKESVDILVSRFTLRVIKGRQRRLAVNHFPIYRDRLLRKLNEWEHEPLHDST